MTLQEFVSTLRERKEIIFPEGNKLEARADLLAPMLADSLMRLLLPADVVHCGWQTSDLRYDWQGAHESWLVVADDLVKIHAAASKEQRTGEVALRALPLHYVVPTITLSYRRNLDEGVERETLISMQLEVSLEGETLNPVASGNSIDALTGFVRHLRDATARARREVAKGEKVTNGQTR